MLSFRVRADVHVSWSHEARVLAWAELREILSQPLPLASSVQLHLMRHGETVTNARSLITGSRDVPLTAVGEEQARRIGLQLDPQYDLALHSTLSRSRQTLLLALPAGHTKVAAIASDPRLNERSLGVLELQPWRPVDEYARGNVYYAPEGGDTYADVARRCLSLLLDLYAFVKAARPEKILVCSHMGPLRILLGILEERPDPVQVLAQSFENTEVVQVPWNRLALPAFLRNST